MSSRVSVIIPNRNGGATLGKCLEAVFASEFVPFEVIVVDDSSHDDSIEVASKFPCKLVKLQKHSGASVARNSGVAHCTGEIIFFTDSDCSPEKNTILIAVETLEMEGPDVIVGGTYTREPCDKGFFNRFQSIFINYFETKKPDDPDYIATHAMTMDIVTFRNSGGFSEEFLPILEDVEFSHRLKRAGYRLVINPSLQVRHIFNFSFLRSIKNAARKSMYWTMYSIKNRDLLSDSGTASTQFKLNVMSSIAISMAIFFYLGSWNAGFFYLVVPVYLANVIVNRKLLYAFHETGGAVFVVLALLYYTTAYALAAGAGAVTGMLKYLFEKNRSGSIQ